MRGLRQRNKKQSKSKNFAQEVKHDMWKVKSETI